QLTLFDILIAPDGARVLDHSLIERRIVLETFVAEAAATERLQLSPCTRSFARARRWLDELHHGTDGVVAKRLDAPYTPGERTMVKVKPVRSADCVVGGFRYASKSREVGSL